MTIEYHWDLIQNTEEWHKARLGVITGSQMSELVTPTLKIANNDKSRGIIYRLAAERITLLSDDNYQSYDMLRGQKEEVLAKDLYSEHYNQVKDCGFVTNDKLGFKIGYSPDGLVGDDGGIEVKSKKAKLQVQTIIEGVVPKEHIAQVQSFFFVTDREWCDFISYSNGMHMFVKPCEPDSEWQGAIAEACIAAEAKINEMVEDYKAKVEKLHKAPWVDVMDETITSSEEFIDYTMAG